MLKILKAGLQQYVNHEIPDVQAGFKKGEEREIKLPTSAGSWKKREFQKNICFIDYAKAFDCGSQETVKNSERDGNTRPSDLKSKKVSLSSQRKIIIFQRRKCLEGKED